MRISDWSSVVCSSDLALRAVHIDIGVGPHHHVARDRRPVIIEPLVVEFAPETQRVAIGQHNVALERIAGAMNLGVHGHAAGRGAALVRQEVHPMIGVAIEGAQVQIAPVEGALPVTVQIRSEEHTSELQSLMRISYAVFCLKKKKIKHITSPILTITTRTNRQNITKL